jgi:hypothetical protein
MYPNKVVFLSHAIDPEWLLALCPEHESEQLARNARTLGP